MTRKGAKSGTAIVDPLRAKELRLLLRETSRRATYLFVSERLAPLSVVGYQRLTVSPILRVSLAVRFCPGKKE